MKLPPDQEAIQAKGFRPSGNFIEFPKEDVETSISARFEKIVRWYPDRVAVKNGDESVTYSELNKASNRLAHTILRRNNQRGQNIAIVLQQGIEVVEAILGVLKSGNCYVPLDPAGPPIRQKQILEISKASLVVTSNQNLTFARQIAGDKCKVINIDELGFHVPDENPGLQISADTFAYILFTSGSTGEPKGVIQNHRNILHDCMCYTNNLHICSDDRVGLLASVWVGASVHYLYGALLNGASLFPLDLRDTGLPFLARWVIQEKISFFQLSANIFRHFVKALAAGEKFTDLRLIALGSSHVTSTDVEAYRRHFELSCILLNRLSTTETQTIRWNFIDKNSCFETHNVPVGYSVEDMEILLLDESGAEVGADDVGEITVRSRYLSPGYWGRPDQTDAVFQSDPGTGLRLFRTGDLGRMQEDGALQYLGRKDSRIKIRGYTVEIAEIEKTLLDHFEIGEVAVIAEKDELADNRLVAYVVPQNRLLRLSTREIRSFLGRRLPHYMVPSVFVILDTLPLTSSGKLDRRALPSPKNLPRQVEQAYRPPTAPMEEEIAGIWAKVLGVEPVGVNDNFFDLGGDSLVMTEVISQIRHKLQTELSFRDFFNNPTIAEVAAHLSRPHQKATAAGNLSISRTLAGGRFPLSVTQQSLWFLNQLDPRSSMYNEILGLRFRGDLNLEALRKAVNEVVERHEALRTNYFSDGGEPYQVVSSNKPIELPVVDLTEWLPSARESEFQRRAVDITEKPFDLSRDLMLRPVLFRLSKAEHILLCIFHHIATDGASADIFTQDLLNHYEQYCAGSEFKPRHLPVRYVDFVFWQRERLQGPLLEEHLSFWRRQLATTPELMKLPTDRPRPDVQNFRGASYEMVLSKSLTEALRTLSSQSNVTLFMTMLAAFQLLVARLSGQQDIVVGSPISGRNQSEFEGVIGLFLNTLVLRTNVGGNPTFNELLGRVREVALAAYDYQDVPYEKLMGDLQLRRSLNHNTLFQLMFAFRRDPLEQFYRLAHVSIDMISIKRQTAKFDLNLAVYERADSLRCHFAYSTDLFNQSTIERMATYYRRLVEEIVVDPGRRILDLPLLGESERHQLMVEWNDTKKDYPTDKCIHEFFEEQARRTPEAIALQFGEQQITYQALNDRANQLAHYLRKQDVGPDTLVGICVERSAEMVVGLLGIIKAGGAYVPLDPNYPTERLAFLLEDAKPMVLLMQEKLADRISKNGVTRVFIDSQWDEISRESKEGPDSDTTLDNLAYVVYTSGSTGKPQGVGITHRGVVNFAFSASEELGLSIRDRVLQFASISFDTSVEEIFPCLLRGATLVLRTESMMGSPSAFLARCRDWGITVLDLPTAYWHEITSALLSDRLAVPESVRLVIIGGERAIQEKLILWHECVSDNVRLMNTYGPTEATVAATVGELTHYRTGTSPTGELPIGRPIPNVQTYILDHNLNSVPVGVTGELHIAGAGLARGYLNSPERTGEKFIPNRFSGVPGSRLYRTGDSARYLPDGNIEFLGRIDHQVKIRGFRIELGEIEASLGQHPSIRESVVLARDESPEDRRLVAYVVAVSGCAPPVNELRSFLHHKLPEYMVPSTFMFLESLPLRDNGKLDRKALPVPNTTRPELEELYIAPRSNMEQLLVKIWAEVLKIEKIGVHDNFFDLGGHSLLATQVMSRAGGAFHVEIPLRMLFEHPTIASLAVQIVEIQVKTVDQEEMADLISEVESLSDEEVQKLAR